MAPRMQPPSQLSTSAPYSVPATGQVSQLLGLFSLPYCRRPLPILNYLLEKPFTCSRRPLLFFPPWRYQLKPHLKSLRFLHFLRLENDQIWTYGVVLLHHRSTHRSLLLQLFNINSFQISLTRWFIFKNNTHSAAFLLSSPLHPFTVCLTRQLHFRGTEGTELSCRGCPDGPATRLSCKQSSIIKWPTRVSAQVFHRKSHSWTLSCLRRQMCTARPSTVYVLNVYIFLVLEYLFLLRMFLFVHHLVFKLFPDEIPVCLCHCYAVAYCMNKLKTYSN